MNPVSNGWADLAMTPRYRNRRWPGCSHKTLVTLRCVVYSEPPLLQVNFRGLSFRGFKAGATKHSGRVSQPRAAREGNGHHLSREWRQAAGPHQELRQVFINNGNGRARAIDLQACDLNDFPGKALFGRASSLIE